MFKPGDQVIPAASKYPRDVLRVDSATRDGFKAYPTGGGPLYSFDRKAAAKYAFRVVTAEEKARPTWYAARFAIDDGPSYPGWTHGRRWNGWAMPIFSRDTMKEILLSIGGTWDDATDVGHLSEEAAGGGEPEGEFFRGTFDAAIGQMTWGFDGWCWDEDETKEDAS